MVGGSTQGVTMSILEQNTLVVLLLVYSLEILIIFFPTKKIICGKHARENDTKRLRIAFWSVVFLSLIFVVLMQHQEKLQLYFNWISTNRI